MVDCSENGLVGLKRCMSQRSSFVKVMSMAAVGAEANTAKDWQDGVGRGEMGPDNFLQGSSTMDQRDSSVP